jgi:hypothetical protein
MIELAFSSAAGGLKIAKSTKQGDPVNGAVAVFGGTRRERSEALCEVKIPRQVACGFANEIAGLFCFALRWTSSHIRQATLLWAQTFVFGIFIPAVEEK